MLDVLCTNTATLTPTAHFVAAVTLDIQLIHVSIVIVMKFFINVARLDTLLVDVQMANRLSVQTIWTDVITGLHVGEAILRITYEIRHNLFGQLQRLVG